MVDCVLNFTIVTDATVIILLLLDKNVNKVTFVLLSHFASPVLRLLPNYINASTSTQALSYLLVL